jgi:hypothetical protein
MPENTAMASKRLPQSPKKLVVKPAVLPAPSKPRKKTGLSKSDPNYYSKIGAISAAKRKLSSKFFSDMAVKSHEHRTKKSYKKGGRRKKQDAALAELKRDLRAATDDTASHPVSR